MSLRSQQIYRWVRPHAWVRLTYKELKATFGTTTKKAGCFTWVCGTGCDRSGWHLMHHKQHTCLVWLVNTLQKREKKEFTTVTGLASHCLLLFSHIDVNRAYPGDVFGLFSQLNDFLNVFVPGRKPSTIFPWTLKDDRSRSIMVGVVNQQWWPLTYHWCSCYHHQLIMVLLALQLEFHFEKNS